MPTLARLANCKVTLYAADHLPPHFHVLMNDGMEALITIAALVQIRGSVPMRELSAALNWARLNHALLLRTWKELNP